MLYKKVPPYLEQLIKASPALARQFIPAKEEKESETVTLSDPLLEEESMPVKGLVHKYGNRALILLTMNCGAYCRFCTRRRRVSDIETGIIKEANLRSIKKYLVQHPEIKELIISGGDPLTVPDILKKALRIFQKLPQIKVIRIGSRRPVIDPLSINQEILSALKTVRKQPLYLMLHFEHPAEITPELERAIKRLRQAVTMICSQTVFLKGVNDDFKTMHELFSRLVEIGVKPYYLYRCDYVKGAQHFIVPFQKEIQIATQLRRKLSGLACPTYVIDTPDGSGKIPVPLNFWEFNQSKFRDFDGKEHQLKEPV